MTRKRAKKPNKKQVMTARDWITAGFMALSTGGPPAIRVEAIARDLAVSKGSFYWHFKDVAALKSAMLYHWRQVATNGIIAGVERSEATSSEQLRLLVKLATGEISEPYGGTLAEPAIRDWARYDLEAAATLEAVDATRLEFLATIFARSGMQADRAAFSARTLYAALIGLEHLAKGTPTDRDTDLAALLELLMWAAPT
jgi:AcrR family transcriptional regulator